MTAMAEHTGNIDGVISVLASWRYAELKLFLRHLAAVKLNVNE